MNLSLGKRFPDLGFLDHESKSIRLSEIAGKFPLIVVFYRGYW
jgi:peroxiredoxin